MTVKVTIFLLVNSPRSSCFTNSFTCYAQTTSHISENKAMVRQAFFHIRQIWRNAVVIINTFCNSNLGGNSYSVNKSSNDSFSNLDDSALKQSIAFADTNSFTILLGNSHSHVVIYQVTCIRHTQNQSDLGVG